MPKLKIESGIVTVIEGIHDLCTRNGNHYQDEFMSKSVKRWTKPYNKPFLKHHNSWSGEPLGRVIKAEHVESIIDKKHTTNKLYLNVTDPDAIQKIRDNRYSTFSVGVSVYSAKCSICGKDLVKEGWCGHWKGDTYDGKKCEWLIGEYDPDEVSAVNTPADKLAQVLIADLEASQKDGDEEALKEPSVITERRTSSVSAKTAEQMAADVDNLIASLESTESTQGNSNNQNPNPEVKPLEGFDPLKGVISDMVTKVGEALKDKEGPIVEFMNDLQSKLQKVVDTCEGKIKPEDLKESNQPTPSDELKAKVTSLEQKVSNLEDQLAVAEKNTQDAQGKVNALEAQNESLNKQSIELAKFARQRTLEHLVDLKILLGEATIGNKDTVMAEQASSRLSDLLKGVSEAQAKIPTQQRQPQQINPPAGDNTEGGNNDNQQENNDKKTMTAEDALNALAYAMSGGKIK